EGESLMASPAPLCTHVKTNGIVCGSPAVAGTELCYHHSAIKTAMGHVGSGGRGVGGEFAPIPFVFPEDRASMQINFFLLLQAFNEGRIDLKHFKAMMSMLSRWRRIWGRRDRWWKKRAISDQRSAVRKAGLRKRAVILQRAQGRLSSARR